MLADNCFNIVVLPVPAKALIITFLLSSKNVCSTSDCSSVGFFIGFNNSLLFLTIISEYFINNCLGLLVISETFSSGGFP